MPTSTSPAQRASTRRARWRSVIAVTIVAGLATIGATALASPAAAEDVVPVDLSTLETTITDCATYGGEGALQYLVRDPFPDYRDFITVTDSAQQVVHSATYLDGVDFEAEVDLDPGAYTIVYSVERETGGRLIDEQTFTIGACPDLGVAVTPLVCSTDRSGEALLTLTGLIPGELYAYAIEGPGFSVGGPLDEVDETEEIELVGMPPGNYTAYVELLTSGSDDDDVPVPVNPVFDWVGFAIEPCQPAIVVEVTECTAPGGSGEVLLKLSSLVAGVEYEVAVTDRGAPDGAPYGGVHTLTGDEVGTAQVLVSGLPPGRDFTAWVDGVWEAEPWEEPPFVGGGGNFDPLETVALSASADFSLKPCPMAPVKPAALPATGSGSTGDLLLGSVLLLGLGGAALLLGARRRSTDAA